MDVINITAAIPAVTGFIAIFLLSEMGMLGLLRLPHI
jgi:hypothetical protein